MPGAVPHSADELLDIFSRLTETKDEELSSGPSFRAALLDVVDNASEVQDLIEDLTLALSQKKETTDSADIAYAALNESFQNDFQQSLDNIRSYEKQMLSSLKSAGGPGSQNTDMSHDVSRARREILSLKLALRRAFRQKGSLLCSADEAELSSSHLLTQQRADHEPGDFSPYSIDHNDRQHHAGNLYERKFVEEYAAHLGSRRLQAYVTNCGMAAFSTVMHLLAHERHATGTLGLQPMYFENLYLLKRFFPDVLLPDAQSTQSLTELLDEKQPAVVFFDSASNHGESFHHDLATILSWARATTKATMLVIDTTCQPSLLLPGNMLDGLPTNVSVLIIESLAKHHQFGLDLVTGGIILAHAEEAIQLDLLKTRARFGTNLSSTSAASLPTPNSKALLRRMKHHSRNVCYLATQLGSRLCEHSGVIESVTWLKDGVGCDWYKTACFSVSFHERYRSLANYREFQNLALHLAKERNHPLALGTSFGFDVTRLFVTSPAIASESPFLRISVGTETQTEMQNLLAILEDASKSLACLWGEKLAT